MSDWKRDAAIRREKFAKTLAGSSLKFTPQEAEAWLDANEDVMNAFKHVYGRVVRFNEESTSDADRVAIIDSVAAEGPSSMCAMLYMLDHKYAPMIAEHPVAGPMVRLASEIFEFAHFERPLVDPRESHSSGRLEYQDVKTSMLEKFFAPREPTPLLEKFPIPAFAKALKEIDANQRTEYLKQLADVLRDYSPAAADELETITYIQKQ